MKLSVVKEEYMLAGIESIPAIVEELSRDESIIMLVDANLHMMIQR